MSKRILNKIVSLFLIGSMLFSITSLAFASPEATASSNDNTRIQDLINSGLTQKEAEKLVRIEKISKQLEQNGQTLELENNKVIVKDSGKTIISKIAESDKEFIINELEKARKAPKISDEKKKADMDSEIKKNPGRKKYRVNYSEEHWTERDLSTEAVDVVSDNKVKPYGTYTEKLVQTQYPNCGVYTSTNNMKEYNGITFAENWVSCTIDFGPTNPVVNSNMSNVNSGYNWGGLIGVSNATRYLNSTHGVMNGAQAECESQVVYNYSGSVGLTLGGPLSISINSSYGWTQYAIIRSDYRILKYDAYYK